VTVLFNHAIIAARDRHASAAFVADLFGLDEPVSWGPFVLVHLDGGVFLQFAEPGIDDIQMQHYAFLVDDQRFDDIHQRLVNAGIEHWADPGMTLPGQINTNHGGRGVYFKDPAGHGLEVLTRPYGSTP
jgi:catechol 2,3-dioxygenase-like lactoylglutathione lyase family enzyme